MLDSPEQLSHLTLTVHISPLKQGTLIKGLWKNRYLSGASSAEAPGHHVFRPENAVGPQGTVVWPRAEGHHGSALLLMGRMKMPVVI